MALLLPCVEFETGAHPNASVIWLHGLGSDGHDFPPIVPALRLPPSAAVRFIFPHAPERPVTANQGMVMPAWYDILALSVPREIDLSSFAHACAQITALIRREMKRGVAPGRIVLAGFSQGGAVALHTAFTFPQALAGVMALSTYVGDEMGLRTKVHATNRHLPVFQAHGRVDDAVPLVLAQRAREILQAIGADVTSREYVMAHTVCPSEVKDIRAWLVARLQLDDTLPDEGEFDYAR